MNLIHMNRKVVFFVLNYGYPSPYQAATGVFDSAVITLGSQTDTIGHRDTFHVISNNWLKQYPGWG